MFTKTSTNADGTSNWELTRTKRPEYSTHLALPNMPMGLLTSTELAHVQANVRNGWELFHVTVEYPNEHSRKGYTRSDISELSTDAVIAAVQFAKNLHPNAFVSTMSGAPRYRPLHHLMD